VFSIAAVTVLGAGAAGAWAVTSRGGSPHRAAAVVTTTSSITPTTTTTTNATTSTTPPPSSLAGRVIVLDPGHNEHNAEHTAEINQPVDVITEQKPCDTTGTETNDGYSEAAFNTDVTNRVAVILRSLGASVILTRSPATPWGPCVTERAAIGNRARANVAISIHADGGPADGHGFDVIEPLVIAGHNDAIVPPSRELALDVRNAYQAATALPFATYIGHEGIDDRNDLGGLNLSAVPKIFIECGNMRNAGDAHQLEDPNFRQRIATGIANGLEAFLASH
jgi:N-acetylmuramoyl-L-alanine amidase